MSRPIYPKPKSETNNQDAAAGTTNPSIPAKKMSFEELHKKLQARLQNHGVINDLRAELRAKLFHELYEIADPVKVPRMVFGGSEDSQFPLQISNWLVCNHFQRGNFEFTLSTFLRESGILTLPEYNMTFHDVLYIFGIHPHTDFYKTMCEKYKNEKSSGGLLFFIVQHLLMCILPQSMKTYTESSTETESTLLNEDRLSMKLLHEIEYVREKLDSEIKNALNGKAMRESRKENLCDKCQTETDTDMLTNLQLARRENENLQRLLESAEGNLKKQELEFEQKLFEKIKVMEARITSQNSMESNGNLTQGILKVNLERSKLKIKELDSHLEMLKEQNNIVQKQNKSFQSMIESMADYEVLKSDLSLTRRELDLSQARYQEARNQWLTTKEELENKVAQLTLQITSPCLQLLSASQEVQKVLEKSQVEQNTWSQERSHWQGELKKATQALHRELIRVEEQKQHIENLHQVIHNLQLQLEKSRLTIAENGHTINTFRPNPSAKTYPSYLPKESTFRNDFELPETFTPSEKEHGIQHFSLSPSPNSRSDYIKEAKLRIDQLQAEADSLEKKYGQCIKNQRTFASPCQPYQSYFSQLVHEKDQQNIGKEHKLRTEEFKAPEGPLELPISEKVLIAPSSSITSANNMDDTPGEETPGEHLVETRRLSIQSPKELSNGVEEVPNKILAKNPRKDDPGKVTALNLDEAWKRISENTNEKKTPSYEPSILLNLDAEWRENVSAVVTQPSFEEPKIKSSELETGFLSFNKNNIVPGKMEEATISVPENRISSNTVPFVPSVGKETETSLSNVELTRNGLESNSVMNMMDFNPYQHSTPVTVPEGNGAELHDIVDGTGNDSDINLSIGDQGHQSENSNSESMW